MSNINLEEESKVENKPDNFENIYYIYELEISENPTFNPTFKVHYLVFELDVQEDEYSEYTYFFKINGHITSVGSIGNYDKIDCSPEILGDIIKLYNGNFDKENIDEYFDIYKNINFEKNNGENIINGKLYIKYDKNYFDNNEIKFSYLYKNGDESELFTMKEFDNIIEKIKEKEVAKEAEKAVSPEEEGAKEPVASEAAENEGAKLFEEGKRDGNNMGKQLLNRLFNGGKKLTNNKKKTRKIKK